MTPLSPGPLLLLAGVLLIVGGGALIRASGAHMAIGRRLSGAREVRVGDLLGLDRLPDRPVRVTGRIRCPDPILTADDDRLVALHRDIEVRLSRGSWRTIERVRETRGFELWDHDGSLAVDPSRAAEPLVATPRVWRGSPDELVDDAHRAAVARLVAEGGRPTAARSVTRVISVVDRLLVLARVVRAADGSASLAPPPGGYVISALELPAAMRILAGPRRGWLLGGAGIAAAGGLLAGAGLLVLVLG
ncbi:MAG TPA: hypothetical protein VHK63_05130 [Candidatus Limnocylindria bacterium]|nr:hypothetical protein [Candidatus Limnocylindria bacterium]